MVWQPWGDFQGPRGSSSAKGGVRTLPRAAGRGAAVGADGKQITQVPPAPNIATEYEGTQHSCVYSRIFIGKEFWALFTDTCVLGAIQSI